ncbi:MAG: hypothetical protein NWF00_10860 [Candidatus Bathyarchaeota archaeon]|nr:hypothetical protein [Candidatus Bathyarchaeota archaeon]
MSGTTIRKLRQMTIGKDSGYFLLPPRNWLDAVESAENRKIKGFVLKSEGDALKLTPTFGEPKTASRKGASGNAAQLLKQGSLTIKLREIPKGRNVYRVVKVPKAWVRTQEMQHYRKVTAVNVKTEPASIVITPIFGEKLKLNPNDVGF